MAGCLRLLQHCTWCDKTVSFGCTGATSRTSMTSAGHLTLPTWSHVPLMRLSLCGMLPGATSCRFSVRPSSQHKVSPGTLSAPLLPLSAWTGEEGALGGIVGLWGPHTSGTGCRRVSHSQITQSLQQSVAEAALGSEQICTVAGRSGKDKTLSR